MQQFRAVKVQADYTWVNLYRNVFAANARVFGTTLPIWSLLTCHVVTTGGTPSHAFLDSI